MAADMTLGIVKPNATKKNVIGDIIALAEKGGLEVRALRMTTLTRAQAEAFYEVHQERPFFGSLVDFMCSGPVVVMALAGENAVNRWRTIMGATNPSDAAPGTVRAIHGDSLQDNAAHGSDSPENGCRGIAFFFPAAELAALR